MKTLKSGFFVVTGLLACPCHLPLTLPLILALTAGTALGALIAQNVGLLALLMTIYFVVALVLGLGIVGRGKHGAACTPSLRIAKPQDASALLPELAPDRLNVIR